MNQLFTCARCGAQNLPYGTNPCPNCGSPLAYGAGHEPAQALQQGYGSPLHSQPQHTVSPTYAGLGARFVAGIIDGLIVGIPTSVVFGDFKGGDGINMSTDGSSFIVGLLYTSLMLASSWQATVGMKAMSLRITNEADGARISYAQSFGRYFASVLSVITLMIGYIMIAFTDKHQALHDKLANTVVVRDK